MAKAEIESLRRSNEIMDARLSTLDIVARLIGMSRVHGEGHPDPLFMINEALAKEAERWSAAENTAARNARLESAVAAAAEELRRMQTIDDGGARVTEQRDLLAMMEAALSFEPDPDFQEVKPDEGLRQ